jgi:hypothetical protein
VGEVEELELTFLRASFVGALVRRFWEDFGRNADEMRSVRLGLLGDDSIFIDVGVVHVQLPGIGMKLELWCHWLDGGNTNGQATLQMRRKKLESDITGQDQISIERKIFAPKTR